MVLNNTWYWFFVRTWCVAYFIVDKVDLLKKSLIKLLDLKWAEKIKEDGFCKYCGKTSHLNAHHVFSRSSRSTRWDLENGICQCSGCHTLSSKFSAHLTGTEFTLWIIDLRGWEWYADLRERWNKSVKFFDADYPEIRATLV